MKNDGVEKMDLSTQTIIMAGHPFRGRIEPAVNVETVIVQMRDITAEGINWASCIRAAVPGRRPPTWLQPGDILLPARGNVSRAVLIDEQIGTLKAVAAPHFFLLRIKDASIVPAYLAWWLNQEPAQRHLQQKAQSSTLIRNITRTMLETVPLALPPLPQQQKLAKLAAAMRQEETLLTDLHQCNQQIMTGLARDLLARNFETGQQ